MTCFDVEKVAVLDKCLGKGAYGTVYLGMHRDTGQQVAVKQISFPSSENGKAKQQLEKATVEIQLMKQFKHDNVIGYLGALREGFTLYIYMEYCSGGTLKTLLQTCGKLTKSLTQKFLRHLLRGLDYLHSMCICHRDVKSDNVLLSPEGVVKLGDFGTSKPIQDCFSLCSGLASICGTPWFMAPEVIAGEPYGLPVDVWSLGCTLFEMSTGTHPFNECDNPHAAMYKIASERKPPQLPMTIDPQIGFLVEWCCTKDPRKRPCCRDLLRHDFVRSEDDKEEEEEEEEEIEDYSEDGDTGDKYGGLPLCDVCGDSIAVFMCVDCVDMGKSCPKCWDAIHEGHAKGPLLFGGNRPPPRIWFPRPAELSSIDDSVLFTSIDGGIVTENGQLVELLPHPSHSGPCSLNNDGVCHLSLDPERDDPGWGCQKCTYNNLNRASLCEVCEHPRHP